MCVRESSKTLNHADCLTAQRRRAPPAAPPALPSVPCCHESHSPTATGPRRRRRIRRRRRRGARRESSKTRRVSVVVLRRTTNNYTNNYTHAACHTFLARHVTQKKRDMSRKKSVTPLTEIWRINFHRVFLSGDWAPSPRQKRVACGFLWIHPPRSGG